MNKILAIDLGTKTGFALSGGHGGTWKLASPKEITIQHRLRGDRRLDVRIPRLLSNLETLYKERPFQWLVWEDVLFSSSTLQTQMWSSLRTTLWIFAHQRGLKTECLNTASLKKFATGNGAADKNLMAAWLAKTQPDLFRFFDGALRRVDNNEKVDDNQTDAVHLLLWAGQTLKNP